MGKNFDKTSLAATSFTIHRSWKIFFALNTLSNCENWTCRINQSDGCFLSSRIAFLFAELQTHEWLETTVYFIRPFEYLLCKETLLLLIDSFSLTKKSKANMKRKEEEEGGDMLRYLMLFINRSIRETFHLLLLIGFTSKWPDAVITG